MEGWKDRGVESWGFNLEQHWVNTSKDACLGEMYCTYDASINCMYLQTFYVLTYLFTYLLTYSLFYFN
jgi:hypothetical protein